MLPLPAEEAVDPTIAAFVKTYFSSWSQADFRTYRSCFHAAATLDLKSAEDGWRQWDLKEFFAAQEFIQNRSRSEEVPLGIRVKAQGQDTAFVEVPWRLNRAGGGAPVTGFDWFTLVKERGAWKILHLTFWEDPAAGNASATVPTDAAAMPAAPKPKIIVSGFESFAGRPVNASSELAQAIVSSFPQYDLTFVQVPVVWGAPAATVAQHRSSKPVAWIAFGEGGKDFRVETVAQNRRASLQDNAHQLPPEPLIAAGGPDSLPLQAPAQKLAERLQNAGYQCEVSRDAGQYLCEEMLYTLLREQQSAPESLRHVLFMHVPVHGSRTRIQGGTAPFSGDNIKTAALDVFSAIIATLDLASTHGNLR